MMRLMRPPMLTIPRRGSSLFRTMKEILEPLVRSPRLFQYLAELEALARDEKARRERFYAEVTPDAKWEFINGEVIMHSPASAQHVRVRERLARLIGTYVDSHNLGWAGGEKAMVACTRNDYEPDIIFLAAEKARALTPDQWKFPVPDFVLEVLSDSTQSRDRGVKFADYAAHGVGEYWIVDPTAETIEQYLLGADGNFQLAAKQRDGSISSRAIRGFVLPLRAAFDDQENLRALWAMKP